MTTQTLVRVPAGEFRMGTSIEQLLKDADMEETRGWAKEWKEKGWFKDEQPQHRVLLDEFQIGKYPVTNAQYQAFVQATKHQPPGYWSGGTFSEELAAHPVVNVSCVEDAVAYCEWLTEQLRTAKQLRENEVIRLPTEAEWEKAARGTDGRFWPWGNQWDKTKCNAEGDVGTTPVGKYSPGGDSPYGAADMAGNVWEWCADWYDEGYYEKSPEKNPVGPDSGQFRVVRGGSFTYLRGHVRCAARGRNYPASGVDGFRVVVASRLTLNSGPS
jgi:formylglycine-generating enzyme required for sulfatase activity